MWGVAGRTERSAIGVLKLAGDIKTPLVSAAIINCAAEQGLKQKNWQPLEADGELFYVTRTFPLTVIRPDLNTSGCQVVQQADESKEFLERHFAARGITTEGCKGNSNYIQARWVANLWYSMADYPRLPTI